MSKTINLTIDDETTTFNIPEGWDEVSIGKVQALSEINTDGLTDIEEAVRVLSILGDIDEELLYMITPDQFKELGETIKFINTEIEGKNKESVMVDGEEYFMKRDYSQLTMGEVMSIQLIMKDTKGADDSNNIIPAMDKLLCIFLRKKKENGKLETFKKDFMDRAESFKGINVGDIYDLLINFSFTSDL